MLPEPSMMICMYTGVRLASAFAVAHWSKPPSLCPLDEPLENPLELELLSPLDPLDPASPPAPPNVLSSPLEPHA